jgi:uncharacterized protein (DUF2236 family)
MEMKKVIQDQSFAVVGRRFSPICNEWIDPLTPKEWDDRFPGVLDGVGLLGGAANIILQLAYKPIGAGVVSHSNFSEDVMTRTNNTLTYVAVALAGTSEEKLAYRRMVNRAHAPVKSKDQAEIKYNAMDPDLQLWVAACIAKFIFDSVARFGKVLNKEEAKELYLRLKPLGTMLQVREDMWPADIEAFEAYWHDFCSKLDILPAVREQLTPFIDLALFHPLVGKLFGSFNRLMTAGHLPPELRAQMGLSWTSIEQRKFDKYLSRAIAINKLLPRVIRQGGHIMLMSKFRKSIRLSRNAQAA